MWWIIGLLTITFTVFLIRDTHVKVYYNEYYEPELQREYDAGLPVWALLLIILVGLIPVLNIILFSIFLVFYTIHAIWNPKNGYGKVHIFSLNGNNWLTKGLLAVKKILTRKV